MKSSIDNYNGKYFSILLPSLETPLIFLKTQLTFHITT